MQIAMLGRHPFPQVDQRPALRHPLRRQCKRRALPLRRQSQRLSCSFQRVERMRSQLRPGTPTSAQAPAEPLRWVEEFL
jgi:hypothetical protein